MTCITTTDCAEISTGCCMAEVIESVPEDANWGEGAKEVGLYTKCASAEW
jgi:hypothetical protein